MRRDYSHTLCQEYKARLMMTSAGAAICPNGHGKVVYAVRRSTIRAARQEWTPTTEAERQVYFEWARQHGPPNCWTGTTGHAAEIIQRLLLDIEHLQRTESERLR